MAAQSEGHATDGRSLSGLLRVEWIWKGSDPNRGGPAAGAKLGGLGADGLPQCDADKPWGLRRTNVTI